MFCISLGSVSYPDPSPCTAPGLLLLPLSGFQGQETISANAIQNSHCVPALCSSTHLLPAMFGADSRTTQESLFIQTLCCISLLLPICLISVNYSLTSKWESLIWNIYGCLYTMPRGKITSVHYFYINKNTQKADKTHNCIS